MGKSVFPRLESYSDYRNLALLLVYSFGIVLFPDVVLKMGGVVLWLVLLFRWLRGE